MTHEPNHSDDTEGEQNGSITPVDISRRDVTKGIGLAGIGLGSTAGYSGSVVAQESVWVDDFSFGNARGWLDSVGNEPPVSEDSDSGTYSLLSETAEDHYRGTWENGPILDMSEEFIVNATFKYNWISGSRTDRHVRLGLEPDGGDSFAFIQFNAPEDIIFLGEDRTEVVPSTDIDRSMSGASEYEEEWINVELYSDSETDVLQAKVWSLSEPEPEEYQIERTFSDFVGRARVDVGNDSDIVRESWLDDIRIEGIVSESDYLELKTDRWLDYGATRDYRVVWEDPETGNRGDVTADSEVTSGNPSVVSVDQTEHTITATEDPDVNERIQLNATYEESEEAAFANVTVASPTMDNTDILPPMQRVSATLTDDNIYAIIIAVFGGIFGARVSSAFGGLALATMIAVIAWFGGWLSSGLVLVGLFLSLFIGLNLAANIDYTMQR